MSNLPKVPPMHEQLHDAKKELARLEEREAYLERERDKLNAEIREHEREAATDKRIIADLHAAIYTLEQAAEAHDPVEVARAVHDWLCQRGLVPPDEDLPWKATSGEWHRGLRRAVEAVLGES